MKKIILVIEDDKEEQKRAKEAIESDGYKIVIAENYRSFKELYDSLKDIVSGIITDLHFPDGEEKSSVPFEKVIENSFKGTVEAPPQMQPIGLAVVIQVIQTHIPIVICSNIDGHRVGYMRDVINGLSKIIGNYLPLITISATGEKDWKKALKHLEEKMKGEK